MCLINNKRGLLKPGTAPFAPRSFVPRGVTSRELPVSVPAERERERGRSDGPNTDRGSCARDWIHRIQKKYRQRKRKRPLLPLRRTAERDSRGETHQYNLSSDQHSHCPRRSVCVFFFLYTLFRLGCLFYRRLDLQLFGGLFLSLITGRYCGIFTP